MTAATDVLAPSRLRRGATRTGLKILVDVAFSVLLFMGTIVGVIALATLIWTIFDSGWERLVADPAGFLTSYVSRLPARAGIKAALVGSAYLMVLTALFCFPIGVGAAIYLEEFAPRNRLTNFVEANIANLAGVPSVVYGLLGLGIFARFLRMGPSLLAGALTLAVMSLPVSSWPPASRSGPCPTPSARAPTPSAPPGGRRCAARSCPRPCPAP